MSFNVAAAMVEQSMKKIELDSGCSMEESFLALLNYIAYNLGIPETSLSMNIDTKAYLDRHFKPDVLRYNEEDVLGSIYEEVFKPTLKLASDKSLLKKANQCAKELNLENFAMPSSILDKEVGTGRFIMLVNKKAVGNVMYFGIESNVVAYKVCLVNMKLQGINARIVYCKDSKKVDVSVGAKIWEKANQWIQ